MGVGFRSKMESTLLRSSFSPLFWMFRIFGTTPFYHDNTNKDERPPFIRFKWFHWQTLWFVLLASVQAGLASTRFYWTLIEDTKSNGSLIAPLTQLCLFVETIVVPRMTIFHLSKLKNTCDTLEDFDRSSLLHETIASKTKVMSVTSISVVLILGVVICFTPPTSIGQVYGDSSLAVWGLVEMIFHMLGVLHSVLFVIQVITVCHAIGLRFQHLNSLIGDILWECHPKLNPIDLQWPIYHIKLPKPKKHDNIKRVVPKRDSYVLNMKSLKERAEFLKTHYLMLRRCVENFSKINSFALLLFLTVKLMNCIIFTFWIVISMLDEDPITAKSVLIGCVDLLAIFAIFHAADYIRIQDKSILSSLNKLPACNLSDSECQELQVLILQMRGNGELSKLTAHGLFTVGKHLLPSIVGAIVTYIIILLQLHKHPSKPKY